MVAKTGKFVECEICHKRKWVKGSYAKKYKYFFCGFEHKGEFKTLQFAKKFPKPIFEDLYCKQKKSFREIAKKLGINERTVHRLLDRYGIEIRRGGPAVQTQWINNPKRRELTAIRFARNTSNRIPSKHEKEMMKILLERNENFVFQYPIYKYILDFAFPDRKIAIEIDEKHHLFKSVKAKDAERDTWLKSKGWIVYRIEPHQINSFVFPNCSQRKAAKHSDN